jgi:hypothetical protein
MYLAGSLSADDRPRPLRMLPQEDRSQRAPSSRRNSRLAYLRKSGSTPSSTDDVHVAHLTFETRRVGGVIGDVTVGVDTRPIRDVAFVKLSDLSAHGFSDRFAELAAAGFPDAGSYQGAKATIGL